MLETTIEVTLENKHQQGLIPFYFLTGNAQTGCEHLQKAV